MIPSASRAATCVVAIPCLLRGGTERQTLALVSALLSDGWSVSVVAYHEHDLGVASEFSAAGADVTCLGWPRSVRGVRFVRRLASVLRAQAPEVVHVQYMQPGLLPVVAGRVAGVPHVLATVHHLPPAAARRARTLLRTAFRLCDRMLFVSEAARTAWLGAHGDRAGRSAVVHNPVDLAGVDRALASRRDDAGPPRDDGTASRPLRVGTVARLETIKGVDVLLDAFARSRHRGDVELWIGGGGSLRRGLEARSRAVGVAERVRWLGPLAWQDAVRALASMDVVVVPSRSEGFGLVAAEAMACGRPVVASRVGGLVEVVEDGATGRLVPAEDPVALAAAVDDLLENPSQRRAWGEAARGRARSEFALERYRAAVVETHRACLRPTAPGRAERPVSVRSAP